MSFNDPTTPALSIAVDNHPPRCLLCGVELPRSRSDRRFCTKAHARRFKSWRQKLPILEKDISTALREIAEYARYPQFVDACLSFSNVSKSLNYYAQLAAKRQEKATRALNGEGQ